MKTPKYRVQVIETVETFYDREGGETNLPALARCNGRDDVRVEERSVIVFEATGETPDEIEGAVWAWCAANGTEPGDLELAFPLATVETFDAEAAMEAHLEALNDPRDGWRLPR